MHTHTAQSVINALALSVCFSGVQAEATNFRLDADYREKSVRAAAAMINWADIKGADASAPRAYQTKNTPANLWTNQAVKNKALCAVSNYSRGRCHSLGNRPPSWAFSEHKKFSALW
jgi:hypothetical protein